MFTALQRWIVWFVWALGLLLAVGSGARSETTVTPLIDRAGLNVYCDAVGAAFDTARTSIDVLLSTIEAEANPLVEKLAAARERGVGVRVLLDTSDWAVDIAEKGRLARSHLAGLGIDVRLDDPAVTTHAKLVVVDGATTILGSSNWNAYAFAEHEQANVRIDDPTVGATFAAYFERLWARTEAAETASGVLEVDIAAALAAPRAIVPLPDADGSSLYARLLLDLLPRAHRSIHVAMYRISVYPSYPDSFSNALVDALAAAAGRGVEVRVLLDDCSYFADSAEANLMSAIALHQRGIEVRLDDANTTTHTKLLVIDGASVVLGSTNWNYYSLEQNVETNVAFLSLPEVARPYDDYFELLWRAGRPLR